MKILKLLMNETFAPTSSNSQIEKHCRAIDFAYTLNRTVSVLCSVLYADWYCNFFSIHFQMVVQCGPSLTACFVMFSFTLTYFVMFSFTLTTDCNAVSLIRFDLAQLRETAEKRQQSRARRYPASTAWLGQHCNKLATVAVCMLT